MKGLLRRLAQGRGIRRSYKTSGDSHLLSLSGLRQRTELQGFLHCEKPKRGWRDGSGASTLCTVYPSRGARVPSPAPNQPSATSAPGDPKLVSGLHGHSHTRGLHTYDTHRNNNTLCRLLRAFSHRLSPTLLSFIRGRGHAWDRGGVDCIEGRSRAVGGIKDESEEKPQNKRCMSMEANAA